MGKTNLRQEFGKRIKNLRREHNLTQERFAEVIGIAPRNVSKIETGHSFPSIETLEKIIMFFNISPDILFRFDVYETNIDKREYVKTVLDSFSEEKANIIYKVVRAIE